MTPIAHDATHCYGRTAGGTLFRRPHDSPATPGPHWRFVPGQVLPADATPGLRPVGQPAKPAGVPKPVATMDGPDRSALAHGWYDCLPGKLKGELRRRVLTDGMARRGELSVAETIRRHAAEMGLDAPAGLSWMAVANRMVSREARESAHA